MTILLRRCIRALLNRLPRRLQVRIDGFRAPSSSANLGPGTFVHSSVQILGRAFVRIGANSVISQDGWLNVNHRTGGVPAIEIGNHCFIGRRNFFSSGRRIEVGDYVLTANDCHFLGSSHIVTDPMQPCITTGTTDSDTISIGHNTFLGAGSRVLGHVSIGHGCVVGACALVTRDIPPFSQAAGFPAIVRRRYSFPRQSWVLAAEFTPEDERALPSAADYLSQLRLRPAPHMPYLAAGSDMGHL